MSSKKNIAKQIKKQILNNDFDYDYLYDELVDNSEDVLSGILNAYLYLFRNVDNICNEECLNNLNDLLYHYVRKNKNKKDLELVYKKIEVFLSNVSMSLDYEKLLKVEKYISILVNLQNKCIMNNMRRAKGDKYNFILYLMNVRFRLWVIILIILISVIGFIVGIFQQIYLSSDNKKRTIILSLLGTIPIIILILISLPIVGFIAIFSYKPEHTTMLDDKKYVAVVSSFLHVDVDYYDYYGFLLMGTKVKVHGYFGKGGFDPFVNPNVADGVEYTYYDNKGKTKSKRSETYIKDKDGQIIDKND